MTNPLPDSRQVQLEPPVLAVAERRWPKRVLLVAVVLGTIVSLAGSLSTNIGRPKTMDAIDSGKDSSVRETVRRIDDEFDSAIQKLELESTGPADWLTICRRVNLALVGCGLSLEDIRLLEQVDEPTRVTWWVEHLLQDPRCHHYLSERLTRAYVGTNNGPFLLFRRRKFQLWLADELKKNTAYDVIVRQLIAAEGLWTDQPAVNFLTATMDENDNGRADPIRLAGRTSRAFLGMRIDCLQCHDDFLGNVKLGDSSSPREGTQKDFHQLAAFYSGAAIVNGNVFGGIHDDQADYRVKFLGADVESTVEPFAPFGDDWLPKSGSSRERLSVWVTHPENRSFARATVNRIWALMFGRPLVAPVDDIPIDGPFPPGLEGLADDFASHQFDLRRLIRILSQLQVFQRDSRSESFEISPDHEKAWAVFPLTQLRPEQVAGSIHQACRLKTVDEDSGIIPKLEKFGYINDFTQGFGDRGEDEFTAQSVTIPQRLLMMNGGLVTNRTEPNPILNATSRIGSLAKDDSTAVEIAYLATMNRLPAEAERIECSSFLNGTRGEDRAQAMADIYWMLFNSTEFQWNH